MSKKTIQIDAEGAKTITDAIERAPSKHLPETKRVPVRIGQRWQNDRGRTITVEVIRAVGPGNLAHDLGHRAIAEEKAAHDDDYDYIGMPLDDERRCLYGSWTLLPDGSS